MAIPRVLIDAERLRQPHSGLGQVALHLGQQYLAHPSKSWTPVFLIPEERRDIFGQSIDTETPSWRRRHAPRLAPRYDLWHVLHQDASYLPGPHTPYVLTIHDLNFLEEKTPGKAARRLGRVQKLVDGAAAITVISNYTRGIVEQNLDLRGTPVEVIYNGLCADASEVGAPPDNLPQGDFLFTLGVVRRKKNFHVLLHLLERLDRINLVIAGNTKDGYADEIRQRARSLGVEHRLAIVGEIDAGQKAWLFNNCKAFVFPSLFEGFGLPLLEAMSYGRPTFAAARSSLPEVGGDDVFYWDSFDTDHMADVFVSGMRAFDNEPERLERLKLRAREFSWENAARQYGALYQRLLSRRL